MFVTKGKYNDALRRIEELENLLKIKEEEIQKIIEFDKLKVEYDELKEAIEQCKNEFEQIEKRCKSKEQEFIRITEKIENSRELVKEISNQENVLEELKQEIEEKELLFNKYRKSTFEIELEQMELKDRTLNHETTIEYLEDKVENLKKQVEMYKTDSLLIWVPISKVNNSISSSMKDCIKNLIIRAYVSEIELITSSLTLGNVENVANKMNKTFKSINDMAHCTGFQLSKDFHQLRVDLLVMLYDTLYLKQEEKERLREIREEERERKRVEREIKEKLRELADREKYLNKEMKTIERELKYQGNNPILIAKAKELQDALDLVNKKREEIEKRKTISTSGYVYIISNIGSFGENIYKIGMTRRLDPLERIRELSSASVPFEFDIHAMILTDDAPKLENHLHKLLYNDRVNLVNNRKEFFNVNLENVKQAVIDAYGTNVIFNEKPKANQYYETLFIRQCMFEQSSH